MNTIMFSITSISNISRMYFIVTMHSIVNQYKSMFLVLLLICTHVKIHDVFNNIMWILIDKEINVSFKAVGTILGLGGGGQKFFFNHPFFSKGYNFVH